MRKSWVAVSLAIRSSLARVFAMVATFTLHIVVLALLIHETRVQAPVVLRDAIEIELRDFEPIPETLPPVRPQPPVPSNARPATTAAVRVREPETETMAPVFAPQSELPPATDLRARIEHQRRAVASDIARETAPSRRAFSGRSIDGMLPDGDNGKLPGFRPRTHDGARDTLRALGKMISIGVPRSATDYHSPTDYFTEGWENRHHSSDMADCDREYARFDAKMRRELCGFVRPPG